MVTIFYILLGLSLLFFLLIANIMFAITKAAQEKGYYADVFQKENGVLFKFFGPKRTLKIKSIRFDKTLFEAVEWKIPHGFKRVQPQMPKLSEFEGDLEELYQIKGEALTEEEIEEELRLQFEEESKIRNTNLQMYAEFEGSKKIIPNTIKDTLLISTSAWPQVEGKVSFLIRKRVGIISILIGVEVVIKPDQQKGSTK